MAVTSAGNIRRLDADNDVIVGNLRIVGIKFVGAGTTPNAQLRDGNTSSGVVVWESAVTTGTETYNHVNLHLKDGCWLDLAGAGSVVYLYLK